MRLSLDLLTEPIKLNDNEVNSLCIENKEYYRNFIGSLLNDCIDSKTIVFSKDFKPIKFKGNVLLINDFYNLSLSSALMKQLYEEISTFCNTELQHQTLQLKSMVANFLENIVENYDYDFTCDYELNLVELLKSQNVKPNIHSENLLNSLLDFLLLINKYTGVKCIMLLNLHLYFSDDEVDLFYKEIIYNHINLLVIENNTNFGKSKYEKLTIIDKDLCEIIEK